MANIRHEVDFKCTPKRLYAVLTDGKLFSEFTGAPAEISAEPGGPFSCFGGMITGRNLELKPNRRIVQAWRAGNLDEGVYSIVRFDLSEHAGATRLVLEHSGFPESNNEHLDGGWHKMYWEPLRKYLASPQSDRLG